MDRNFRPQLIVLMSDILVYATPKLHRHKSPSYGPLRSHLRSFHRSDVSPHRSGHFFSSGSTKRNQKQQPTASVVRVDAATNQRSSGTSTSTTSNTSSMFNEDGANATTSGATRMDFNPLKDAVFYNKVNVLPLYHCNAQLTSIHQHGRAEVNVSRSSPPTIVTVSSSTGKSGLFC